MKKWIAVYLAALVSFVLVDAVWLGFVAKDFYRQQIGFLIGGQIAWSAAVAFYLLFISGLVFFAVKPSATLRQAAFRGIFYGLVTYGTYDLTNQATIENWPVAVTLVDLAWGSFASALAASSGKLIALKLRLE